MAKHNLNGCRYWRVVKPIGIIFSSMAKQTPRSHGRKLDSIIGLIVGPCVPDP